MTTTNLYMFYCTETGRVMAMGTNEEIKTYAEMYMKSLERTAQMLNDINKIGNNNLLGNLIMR